MYFRTYWRTLALLAVMLVGFGVQPSHTAQAQSDRRCFPETGYCISGAIRSYWERNGGLPIFGYPLGDLHVETVEGTWTGPVQLFERDRLEDHSNQGVGVLAGRLGAQLLEQQGRPWQYGGEQPRPGYALCALFTETGYNLCPPFSTYWRERGGLERFGYPITPVFDEMIEGRTLKVQYFERRRLEWHPENAGTPYEVLLGLLGREIRDGGAVEPCPGISGYLRRTWEVYARDLECGQVYGDGRLATQRFEGGQMIWIGRSDGSPGQIVVIVGDPTIGASWTLAVDSYVEGEPVGTNELPPPGRYAPLRGFGKLWRANPEIRQALGWALAPEQGDSGVVVQFPGRSGFSWMVGHAATDRVTILRVDPDHRRALEVPRQA